MKINNLIFLLILTLFACKKEDPDTDNNAIEFPQEYLLTSFEAGETALFDLTSGTPEQTEVAGSFINSEQTTKDLLDTQKENIVRFEVVRFLDAEKLRMKFPFSTGLVDTTLNYVRAGDDIYVVVDGSPTKMFESDLANNQLRHCLLSFWGTYTSSNGAWNELNPGFLLCTNDTDEEMASTIPFFFSFPLDSVAINRSSFVFELQ